MASLTGQTIQSTYDSLLKISGNDPLTASLQRITDGLGNFTPLYLSTTAVEISSGLNVLGSITGSNLSGTNTGDETNSSIKTKLGAASGSQDGYLTSTDWSTFNAKQAALGYTPVPQTRTLTINGTTFDLSADRSWTIAAGVTSFNTRTGAITLTSGDVTGALGYTPYNATNPNAYISLTSLSASSPLSYNNTTGAFSIQQASGSQNGFLSSTDWTTFNSKQNALGYTPVPDTRTITINGTTFDLTANRSFSVGTITGSGTAGRIPLFATSTSLGDSQIFTATDESIGQMIGIGATPNNAPTPHRLFVSGTGYFTNALRVNAGITATSYVISGGNNNQLVAAGGGVVTAGTNITISGGTISANNTSQWITSGSNIYYNTGNVGVNTSTPADRLHVSGNIRTQEGYLQVRSSSDASVYINNEATQWRIRNNASNNFIINDAISDKLTIVYNTGNVGIGTTSPSNLLTISGSGGTAYLRVDASDTTLTGKFQARSGVSAVEIGSVSNSPLAIVTNDTERMRITSAGNVGIGTTSPGERLEVAASTPFIRINDLAATSENGLSFASSGNIRGWLTINYSTGEFRHAAGISGNTYFQTFHTNGSERMRITSGGQIGINNTNPTGSLTTTAFSNGISLELRARSAEDYSQINFSNNAGTLTSGIIGMERVNSSTSAYDMYFYTKVGNGGSAERMRIAANGNVGIGTTSPTAPIDTNGVRLGRNWNISGRATVRLDSDGTANPADVLFAHTSAANQGSWTGVYWSLSSRAAADGNKFQIWRGDGNPGGAGEATLFTIQPNGNVGIGQTNPSVRLQVDGGAASVNTNTGAITNNTTLSLRSIDTTATNRVIEGYSISYSALFYVQNNGSYFFAGSNLSDARTKKDINYLNDSVLDKVMQLKPASFKYIQNDENVKGGFIAQDVKEIFPDLVTKTQSEEDMMGVDYYGVIGILTKAIQEQQAQINELKARLENGI